MIFEAIRKTRFGKLVVFLALTTVIVGVVCVAMSLNEFVPPRFETRGWSGRGTLMLRTDSVDPDVLLMGFVFDGDLFRVTKDGGNAVPSSPVFYRYRAGLNRLEPVDVATWKSTSGPIQGLTGVFIQPFEFDVPNDRLTFKAQSVQARGQTVLGAFGSPSGELVAVLSASGQRFGGFMPFVTPPRPGGARYHQVFRREDGKEVGTAVRLPFDFEHDTFGAYWSADERYVVYPHTGFESVAVIPVPFNPREEGKK